MNLRTLLKSLKIARVVPPQLKDAGAFASNTYFDTQGLSGVLFLLVPGVMDAAVGSDNDETPPKIEECDTTNGTYTAVTGAALSAVIGADDADNLYGIFIDKTMTTKRYMQIDTPTAGNGTTGCNFCAIALGFPPEVMPKNAAEMGLAELVEVPAVSLS